MLHGVLVYLTLLRLQVRAAVQQGPDFWLLVTGAALTQGVGIGMIAAIFSFTRTINGWGFWELCTVYALMALADGVAELLFDGVWQLPRLVHQGELDYTLTRPFPPVLQVSGASVGVNGFGNITIGVVLLVSGLRHLTDSYSTAVLLLFLVVSGPALLIKAAVNLMANASVFWMRSPFSSFAASVHEISGLARYPLTIYPPALRGVLTVAMPVAFVGFFPVSLLMQRGVAAWVGVAAPVVTAATVLVAVHIFARGLRRYEGAGH